MRSVLLRALNCVPELVLRVAARFLARPRPLELFPGWRFAVGEAHPTLGVSLRLAMWQTFKTRGIASPVRVRWHDNLALDLVLGNDQSRCLYVSGSFEPNEFYFLSGILSPGITFVDVGANEGFYALFAANKVSPATVYAFEPSPRERARLEHNVRINRLQNVLVFSQGLADEPGTAILHLADPEHNGQNTLGEFGYRGVERAGDIEINLTTIDWLRAQGQMRRVDILKMDVEGAEMKVLIGARETLNLDKPVILMELFDAALRGQGTDAETVLQFLKERGFLVFAFDPDSGSLRPLQRTLEGSANIVACHPASRFYKQLQQ